MSAPYVVQGVSQSQQQGLQGQTTIQKVKTQQQQSADDARKQQMRDGWDAFYGKFPNPLVVRNGANDNVIDNLCRTPVLKGVAALFGKEVTFEIAEDAPLSETQRDAAQKWLDKCWKWNKKAITLKKWALNSGVCGTGFLKVVPAAGKPYPRIIVQDPTMVSVQSAPDDVETPVGFEVQWQGYDANAQQMDYREVTIQNPNQLSWLIIRQEREHGSATAQAWTTTNTSTWPYSWPPIHHNQNLPAPNSFFGMSDISPDIIQLNKDRNFVLSNMARILRFHAHPKTWAKGLRAEQLQVAIDETLILNNKDAEIGNLEMQSDLHSSLQFARILQESIEGLTQVPAITTGANIDTIPKVSSGIALVVLHQPLIDKTVDKQETYGDTLEALNSHLLELGGFGIGIEVDCHWQNILVKDDLMEAQVAQAIDQMGLASKQTLSTRLGFDWAQEQERMADEAKDAADANNAGFGMDPLAAAFGKQPLPPEGQPLVQKPTGAQL
jgi:hypothetical protein